MLGVVLLCAAAHLARGSGRHERGNHVTSNAEANFSPLTDINTSNVAKLGLAWWFDIPGVVRAESMPLQVDGTMYFATGYSVVRAVDAASGRLLWTYDPEVAKAAGRKLRLLWGIRGISFLDGRVYVGTHDGRLIAIDARSGKMLWSLATAGPDDNRIITGAPLVYKRAVVIGHAVSDFGPVRGYVTAYDAVTGKRLWRFFTVPGDPKAGFENKAMRAAAATWTGDWWKQGGGGAVWNSMVYDADLNRVYFGTSNGYPTRASLRSPGGGDNLFLASIVALNADSGEYAWHYQTNPSETWDYDATTDLQLADLTIKGVQRRVLMQASKNGFFYVIDRDTGKLISAEPFVKVTWADRIDLKTGRPLETIIARDESQQTKVWPHADGAHGIAAMAFNSQRNVVYIPTLDASTKCNQADWKGNACLASSLTAWNPIKQTAAWRIPLPGIRNGGVVATAGDLVFQGRCDGWFVAYAASSGKELWSFDAQVGVMGAPISYKIGGQQYISVMAGYGGGAAYIDPRWDARTQPRRVLTFAINGKAELPRPPSRHTLQPVLDADFQSDATAEAKGGLLFGGYCSMCHGVEAHAGGAAPDLRESPIILSADAFSSIVMRGALLARGMPQFENLSEVEADQIRQFLRAQAKKSNMNVARN